MYAFQDLYHRGHGGHGGSQNLAWRDCPLESHRAFVREDSRSFAPLRMTVLFLRQFLWQDGLRSQVAFDDGGEEAVAGMNAGNRSQVGSTQQRINILPDQLTRALKLRQFLPAVHKTKCGWVG